MARAIRSSSSTTRQRKTAARNRATVSRTRSSKSSPSAKLKVTLLYSGETLIGFTVFGHAGYAEYGEDIVCSAVSALTQAAAMGLSEYINVLSELKIQEGEMRLKLKKGLNESHALQAKAILEAMRLGLLGILEEYPDHIEIIVKTEEDSI